jgi:hypothetical protein
VASQLVTSAATKLSEDAQFTASCSEREDRSACDSADTVCGIRSVNKMLDEHLNRLEGEEEVAEHKATFLDPLKRLNLIQGSILL